MTDEKKIVDTLADLPYPHRRDKVYCSFCGKETSEIKQLIAGPTAFICNECVDQCYEIIHPEVKNDEA